eukprot:TRINITY_DN7522_c0_g1_i1.p1 TRINITY_DN7522_c0_g1~~TRINITY_DN7522_c0_g1_i1.p1  ORF type:complete len:1397 (+),score=371.04 TRINITY_DN7522_c0_g1_i1:497-4192(+)
MTDKEKHENAATGSQAVQHGNAASKQAEANAKTQEEAQQQTQQSVQKEETDHVTAAADMSAARKQREETAKTLMEVEQQIAKKENTDRVTAAVEIETAQDGNAASEHAQETVKTKKQAEGNLKERAQSEEARVKAVAKKQEAQHQNEDLETANHDAETTKAQKPKEDLSSKEVPPSLHRKGGAGLEAAAVVAEGGGEDEEETGRDCLQIHFAVHGVSYDLLQAQPAQLSLFETIVKEVIVQHSSIVVGHGLLPEHVQLKLCQGSVLVTAEVSPFQGLSPELLRSCFRGSEGTLSKALSDGISGMRGIARLQSEEKGLIAVGGLHLQLQNEDPPSPLVSDDGFLSDETAESSDSPDQHGEQVLVPINSYLARPPAGTCWVNEEWGGASSSRASSQVLSSRGGSPRRQQGFGAQSRSLLARSLSNIATSALGRFRSELRRREGSFANAWRKILDPHCNGFITFSVFCEACRRINYHGNIRDAWNELDADRMGKATLCELDWATAEALGHFITALSGRYEGLDRAAKQLGLTGGRRLRQEEFCKALTKQGLAGGTQAVNLFRMICNKNTQARPAVGFEEFHWLAQMSPHLPQPTGSRVQPGALADSHGQAFDNSNRLDQDSDDALNPDDEKNLSATPAAWESKNQDASGDESTCSETIYQKLHREAMEYHGRKLKKMEQDNSVKQQPEAFSKSHREARTNRKTGDPEAFHRLHQDAGHRKLHREKQVEEFLLHVRGGEKKTLPRQKIDETFKRLANRRNTRIIKHVEAAPDLTKTNLDGTAKPKPEGNIEIASERLFKDHYRRLERKKERYHKAVEEKQMVEDQAMAKGPAYVSREKEQQIVKRLHGEERRVRQRERQKQEEEKKAAEEELERLARLKAKGKARPETFYRLYLEGMQRDEARNEKRRMMELEEEIKLKADSVHSRTIGNPKVFHRLYTSTTAKEEAEREAAEAAARAAAEADRYSEVSEIFDAEVGESVAATEHRGQMVAGKLDRRRHLEELFNGGRLSSLGGPSRKSAGDQELSKTQQELDQVRKSRLAMMDWMEEQNREYDMNRDAAPGSGGSANTPRRIAAMELEVGRSSAAAARSASTTPRGSRGAAVPSVQMTRISRPSSAGGSAAASSIAARRRDTTPPSSRSKDNNAGSRGGSPDRSLTPRAIGTAATPRRSMVDLMSAKAREPIMSKRRSTMLTLGGAGGPRQSLAALQLEHELFGSASSEDEEPLPSSETLVKAP